MPRRDDALAYELEIAVLEGRLHPQVHTAAGFYVDCTGKPLLTLAESLERYRVHVEAAKRDLAAGDLTRISEYLAIARNALLGSIAESLSGAARWQIAQIEDVRQQIRIRAGSLVPELEARVQDAIALFRRITRREGEFRDTRRRAEALIGFIDICTNLNDTLEDQYRDVRSRTPQRRVAGIHLRSWVLTAVIAFVTFLLGVLGEDLVPTQVHGYLEDASKRLYELVFEGPAAAKAKPVPERGS